MIRAVLSLLTMVPLAAFGQGTVAGTLTVTRNGQPVPVKDAVLFIRGYSESPPPSRVRIQQAGRSFHPAVSIAMVGQGIEFTNDERDGLWHHVFSPTPREQFDLGRYRSPEKRRQTFYHEGRVDIFCNIHKEMYATLWVVPNSRHAQLSSGAAPATFKLEHVHAGTWTLAVWQPGAQSLLQIPVTVQDGRSTHVKVRLELGQTPLEALIADHPDLQGRPYTDANRAREKGGW